MSRQSNDLVIVVDRVDIISGEVLSRTETTGHGWESPEAAVAHWRSLTSFTAYENGRVVRNEAIGLETRAYFDVR